MNCVKNRLIAVRAFIQINICEVKHPEIDYVTRLSKAVQLMDNNEEIFDDFTKLFNMPAITNIMIDYIQKLMD